MSTIVDDLRDGGMHPLCWDAADEIEELEKSYALVFKDLGTLQLQYEKLRTAMESFRDTVLNQSGLLAENGMTTEQINDVLNEFDGHMGEAVPA